MRRHSSSFLPVTGKEWLFKMSASSLLVLLFSCSGVYTALGSGGACAVWMPRLGPAPSVSATTATVLRGLRGSRRLRNCYPLCGISSSGWTVGHLQQGALAVCPLRRQPSAWQLHLCAGCTFEQALRSHPYLSALGSLHTLFAGCCQVARRNGDVRTRGLRVVRADVRQGCAMNVSTGHEETPNKPRREGAKLFGCPTQPRRVVPRWKRLQAFIAHGVYRTSKTDSNPGAVLDALDLQCVCAKRERLRPLAWFWFSDRWRRVPRLPHGTC